MSRARVSSALLAALLLSCAPLTGCSYRPARFAGSGAVSLVGDDDPVPLPGRRGFNELLQVSDVYLRRPLFDVFNAVRFPHAGDVNVLDEVPWSSWYHPPASVPAMMDDPNANGGPPVPPLSLLEEEPSSSGGGVVVADARGFRYELRGDSTDRPEMYTAAAAIGSRLTRAFGLLSPGVWVSSLRLQDFARPFEPATAPRLRAFLSSLPPATESGYRLAATRWPVGIDCGLTPDFDARRDDPNDLIAHSDRRTLRALKVLASWLSFRPFGTRNTRDAYVGEPGKGHLLHYVVGLEDALGASQTVAFGEGRGQTPQRGGGSVLLNLLTFGLLPTPLPEPTQRRWLAIGAIGEELDPGDFDTTPPYGPMVRFGAPDGYWGAKRLMSISREGLMAAVDSGALHEKGARNEMVRLLEIRRRVVVRYWFDRVTPCEFVAFGPGRVELRDESLAWWLADPAEAAYRVAYLDPDGRALAPALRLAPNGAQVSVPLAEGLARSAPYLVLRVFAERRGRRAPRSCDIHLDTSGPELKLIGVRH